MLLAGFLTTVAAEEPEYNINSRYTVESVEVLPARPEHLSRNLREEMQGHIGEKYDPSIFEQLRDRLRQEVKAPNVSLRLQRGSQPDRVRVLFEVADHKARVDVAVPEFLYNSRQGWSGEIDAIAMAGRNRLTLGVLSDGNSMVERFAGLRACYERSNLGSSRVRFALEFGTFHQQWNRATLTTGGEPGDPGIYRERLMLEPRLTFSLSRSLSLTTGVSFARLQMQDAAARFESANAVTNSLRYRRHPEDSNSDGQELDAGYNLRAATSILGSGRVYTRHTWDIAWSLKQDHQRITIRFAGGVLNGDAPFFERFYGGELECAAGVGQVRDRPTRREPDGAGLRRIQVPDCGDFLRLRFGVGSERLAGGPGIGRHRHPQGEFRDCGGVPVPRRKDRTGPSWRV